MTAKRFTIEKKGGMFYIFDAGNLIPVFDGQPICDLLNELYEENKELQDTIETICKDFEESHGMDIRNADWFTAW